jgi:hypothetical protein
MFRVPGSRRFLALAACCIGTVWFSPALAQAWLPHEGEVSYSTQLTSLLNRKHYLPNGDELDLGHTRSEILGLAVAWSPSERWQLNAGIPYVRTQWLGEGIHGPETDHGHHNATFTDLRIEAHFQAFEAPFALAPYVAVVWPVKDYPVLGHAAPGRHLDEYWIGFFAGRTLDEWVPGSYLQLRYNYAFVEKVQDIKHDNSNLDLEVGYYLGTDWAMQLTGSWRWAHGGVDLPVAPSNPLFPDHDRLAAAEYFNLGAGVSWFATERYALSLTWTRSLRGSNAHKVDRELTLGINFTPSLRQ